MYIVVVSIVVLSYPILFPVVRELWTGANCMRVKSVGLLSKSHLEWASYFLIFLIISFKICLMLVALQVFR